MNTTSRRGFLGALLAAAAAPAFVKADSLMKIVVPSTQIILPPSLNIALTGGLTEGAAYAFSMWMKGADGKWVQVQRVFTAAGNQADLKIDLPVQHTAVWGTDLRAVNTGAHAPEVKGWRHVAMQMNVVNGSLVYDDHDTPFSHGGNSMTDQQTKALRLADAMEGSDAEYPDDLEVAAELRRLHAVETMANLARAGHEQWFAECQRLHAVSAQLLEALEDLYAEQNGAPLIRRQAVWEAAMSNARAAIAAAKEQA